MKGLAISNGGSDGQSQANNPIYVRDFQAMLGEDAEESCLVMEKKRRLKVDQVKALEKNFEADDKLQPERKLKSAQELGLQPRQVAVWFQNRRARWKTKQLERDYNILKAEHDSLKHSLEKLHHENETFLKEIEDLKSQMKDNREKEDTQKKGTLITGTNANIHVGIALNPKESQGEAKIEIVKEMLGGNSESDSSAVVNEDNSSSPMAAISSSSGHFPNTGPRSAPQITPNFEISKGETILGETHKAYYYPHVMKIEEHNVLGEDSCSSFFAVDQAPNLHWHDWNRQF